MRYGGLDYKIEYSDSADGEQGGKLEFFNSHLPSDLVCGLVTASWEYPDQKQAVLDALSCFQILSKQWASTVLDHFLDDGYLRSPLVFFGSWYGVQHALLARRVANFAERRSVLIDIDPTACDIAERLLGRDDWRLPFRDNTRFVCGDALNFDLCMYGDECGADPVVIWTGIEHFDEAEVKAYIKQNDSAGALYLLQGTNMPANDHRNLIYSCGQLEQYFEGDPIYSARLTTPLGDRFQTVFAT